MNCKIIGRDTNRNAAGSVRENIRSVRYCGRNSLENNTVNNTILANGTEFDTCISSRYGRTVINLKITTIKRTLRLMCLRLRKLSFESFRNEIYWLQSFAAPQESHLGWELVTHVLKELGQSLANYPSKNIHYKISTAFSAERCSKN